MFTQATDNRLSNLRGATALFLCSVFLLSAATTLVGCASRLKMKIVCETPSGTIVAKVRESFYVPNLDVSDALQKDFLVASDGSLAALELSLPDTSIYKTTSRSRLPIVARPSLDMRVYWPLPADLAAGQKGKRRGAFVDLFGNYEDTPAERIFQLAHGDLIIDSVKSEKLYVTIAATFRSLAGDSLRFDGRTRLSPRDRLKFENTSYQLNDR